MKSSKLIVLILLNFELSKCKGIFSDNRQLSSSQCGESNEVGDFSPGNEYHCMLDIMGDLYCSGANLYGQLGYGDTISRSNDVLNTQPVDLGSGRKAKQIHCTVMNSCVVLESDDAICWGMGIFGLLGTGNRNTIGNQPGSMGDSLQVIDLGSGRKIKKLVAGKASICTILDNDKLKCWGTNEWYQLGYDDNIDRGGNPNEMGDNLPYAGNNSMVKDVRIGALTMCIFLFSDEWKCFGANGHGQLGLGDTIERPYADNSPIIDVVGGIKDLSVGDNHMCALLNDESVKCWGKNNNGQLGYGDILQRGDEANEMGDHLPSIDLGTDAIPVQITAGFAETCVLLDNNKVKCWGYNQDCRLGYGDSITRGDNPDEMGDHLPFVDTGPGVIQEIFFRFPSLCLKFDDNTIACRGSETPCSTTNVTALKVCNKGYTLPTNFPSSYPSNSYFPSSPPSIFECFDNTINIKVVTDINPYYSSWFLKNTKTQTIVMKADVGHYTKKNTEYEHNYCFDVGAIEFSFKHDLADWNGEYTVSLNEKIVQHEKPNGYFHQESVIASYCTEDNHCDDSNACTQDSCDKNSTKCVFSPHYSNQCRSAGIAETLVIRVVSLDTSTTASKEELGESFFGDQYYTMKSQFFHCSYGILDIRAFSGLTSTNKQISNGIVDMEIDMSTLGEKASIVETAVIEKANLELGDLSKQFAFVIVCIPPGTSISGSVHWVAYAYVNSFISIYNDINCLYPSVQMHEVGHNIGLSHSNDDKNYGDTSGMMGASSKEDFGPVKCFNAPKSFELGWYSGGGYIVMDIEDILMKEVELIGITDFQNRGLRSTHMKIINCQNGFDYFVSFNRNTDMNRDTGEGRNKVLVHKRVTGEYYSDSTLLAKLGHNQKFTIYDLGPKGDWNLQIIPNIYLLEDPAYTRISFLKWSSYCSTDKSCDDHNACTIDKCIKNAQSFHCINTLVSNCNECGASIEIDVHTNDWPNYITWELYSFTLNRIVKSNIYYLDKFASYTYQSCHGYGRYKFSISYSDNSTQTNSSSNFKLSIGEYPFIFGNISLATYSETIFTICEENEDCFDWDGCSVDFCDIETKICNNSIVDSLDDCSDCSWVELEVITDNFAEETNWALTAADKNVVSGNPFPLFINNVFGLSRKSGRRKAPTRESGRRKAPTRSGRRKAPTRASALVNEVLEETTDVIYENVCLENSIKYHFVITDTFGDGICCEQGDGSYHISTLNKTITSGGDFSLFEEIYFKFSDLESGCEDNDVGTRILYDPEIRTCFYYDIPCEEYGAIAAVYIRSDIYADDTSWKVIGKNNTIMEGGMYEMAFTEYESRKCLPVGSYLFEVYDSQENGMSFCFDQECGFEVKISSNTVIKNDGSFGEMKRVPFGICVSDEDCDDSDDCTVDYCNKISNFCIFEQNCELCSKVEVTIDVQTDYLFSLTSWKMWSLSENLPLSTDGPYVQSYHQYEEILCLSSGLYEIVFFNSEGRGFSICDTGNCGYSVFVKDTKVITSDGSFSFEEKRLFGICDNDDQCDDMDSCTSDTCDMETSTCVFRQLPCVDCNRENVTIQVRTDSNCQETSWVLKTLLNNSTEIFGGPYTKDNAFYQVTYCIAFDEYSLSILDSEGNGLNECNNNDQNCGYSVLINDDEVINRDGSFLRNESHIIGFCNSDLECNDRDDCTIDTCNRRTKLCEFKLNCWECFSNSVAITINTDENGANTAWFILQRESVIASGGVYARNFAKYQHLVCLSHSVFSFEILYRDVSSLSSLSTNGNAYEVAVNGEKLIESKGFEVISHEMDLEVNDRFYIEFISASIVDSQVIRLNYFIADEIELEQFVGAAFEETCESKDVTNSFNIQSGIEDVEEKDVKKGHLNVSFAFQDLLGTIFWRNNTDELDFVSLCIRAELTLNVESNLSVSFVETRIIMKVNIDQNFAIKDINAQKNEIVVLEEERQINLSACICDNLNVCIDTPIIYQNSEIKICVQSLNHDLDINRFENVWFYQDGILKCSPVQGGHMMDYAESYGGSIGVLKTRALSSLFELPNPSDLLISGEVLLVFKSENNKRMLIEKERKRFGFKCEAHIRNESLDIILSVSFLMTLCMFFAWFWRFLLQKRMLYKRLSLN